MDPTDTLSSDRSRWKKLLWSSLDSSSSTPVSCWVHAKSARRMHFLYVARLATFLSNLFFLNGENAESLLLVLGTVIRSICIKRNGVPWFCFLDGDKKESTVRFCVSLASLLSRSSLMVTTRPFLRNPLS